MVKTSFLEYSRICLARYVNISSTLKNGTQIKTAIYRRYSDLVKLSWVCTLLAICQFHNAYCVLKPCCGFLIYTWRRDAVSYFTGIILKYSASSSFVFLGSLTSLSHWRNTSSKKHSVEDLSGLVSLSLYMLTIWFLHLP